jgi:hypothetical protein
LNPFEMAEAIKHDICSFDSVREALRELWADWVLDGWAVLRATNVPSVQRNLRMSTTSDSGPYSLGTAENDESTRLHLPQRPVP